MKTTINKGITSIEGIKVGHWTNQEAKTGCTVIICENGAVAGVDVRGAAPGTRETDLLKGYHSVEKIHAVLLSGGSAFGLDAASGVMQYLEENKIGVDVGITKVPIVTAAVIFDLMEGNPDIRPGKEEGYIASKCANTNQVLSGEVGAGTGATAGKSFGQCFAQKGGIGNSFMDLGNGVFIAALAVVNAFGDIYNHKTGEVLASPIVNGRRKLYLDNLNIPTEAFPGTNTTLGVIATNATLTREQANKLAEMAQDGFALSIRPVHTPLDGDTVFALSTSQVETGSLLPLFAAAPEVMSMAIESVFINSKL